MRTSKHHGYSYDSFDEHSGFENPSMQVVAYTHKRRSPFVNHELRNEFLKSKLSTISHNNKLADAIEQTIYSVNFKIMTPLMTGEKEIKYQSDLGDVIEKETKAQIKYAALDKMKALRNSVLEKEEYNKRIQIIENKLNEIDLSNMSREEIDKSLGLVPVNDKSGNKISLTFDDRVKSFEVDIDEKNRKAEEFVKKMRNGSKERCIANSSKNKIIEKVLKEQEQFREKQKIFEEIKEKEKAEQYKQMKEKQKQHELERMLKKSEWKRTDKELEKKEYHYLQTEKKYEQEVVLPELERYKEDLKRKKEFYKPINPEEIKEHDKKYQKVIKEKLEEKKQQRIQWYSDIGYGDYDKNKFKTKFLDKFLQNERERKEQEELDKKEKLNKVSKAEKYAKFVKEMHWPKVSRIKRAEMETLKKSVDVQRSLNRSSLSQILKKRITSNRSENREKHIDYVTKGNTTFTGLQNIKRVGNTSYTILQQPKRIWKENKMIPKPVPKKEGVAVDYLLK